MPQPISPLHTVRVVRRRARQHQPTKDRNMNWLDHMIAFISPTLALHRAQARRAMKELQRQREGRAVIS